MPGGLRYNQTELLRLVVGNSMIPLERLRDANFYQFILWQGRGEWRYFVSSDRWSLRGAPDSGFRLKEIPEERGCRNP
jgi:hypothetical protein